jgi:uncharacterized membrane protein YphA (DoxX/SURF4 family)
MDEKLRRFAPAILRIGISLVFLWFGFQQIQNAQVWTSFIPQSIADISPFGVITLVHLNGAFEIVFSLALILGIFTRTAAILLAIHMFDITFVIGYNALGMRDLGLAIAMLAVCLYGPDRLCLDRFLDKK